MDCRNLGPLDTQDWGPTTIALPLVEKAQLVQVEVTCRHYLVPIYQWIVVT